MQTQEQSISPAAAVDLTTPLSDKERSQLERCEAVVKRGLQTFLETGNALATIRDQGLFRETHRDFRTYCRDKWKLGKTHAYRLIDDAEAVAELSPIGDKPANEAQARALAATPPGLRQEVWDEAKSTAPDGKLTAGHIAQAGNRVTAYYAGRSAAMQNEPFAPPTGEEERALWIKGWESQRPVPVEPAPAPEPPVNDLRSDTAAAPDAEARVEAMAETAGVGEIAGDIKTAAGLSPADAARQDQLERQPSPAAVRPPVPAPEPKASDKRKQPLKTMAELAAEKAEKAGKEPAKPSAWEGKTTAVIPNDVVDRLAAVGGDVAPAIATYCDLAEIVDEFGLEADDALGYLRRFLTACCDHEEDPDDVIQAIGAGTETSDAA